MMGLSTTMNRLAILIVSKHTELLAWFQRVLSGQYSVYCAVNRVEAMGILKHAGSGRGQLEPNAPYPDPVAVVLIDDEDDADALMQLLRSRFYFPEFIAITPYRMLARVTQLMRAGASGCLFHPLSEDDVLHQLQLAICSANPASRLSEQARQSDIADTQQEIRQALYQEMLMKRRLEGTILSVDEAYDFFDVDHIEEWQLSEARFQKLSQKMATALSRKAHATVLLIEDEVQWRQVLGVLLSDTHRVLSAKTAEEGLDIIRQTPDLDVVFLDIQMPGMRGDDLLPILLKECPDVRVIMVTAFDDLALAIGTLKAGAFDYVHKPYTDEEILVKLSKALQSKYYGQLARQVRDELTRRKLSDERRLALLTELCEKRLRENQPIMMAEVYVFFPECRASHLSELSTFSPNMILEDGAGTFLMGLRGKVDL